MKKYLLLLFLVIFSVNATARSRVVKNTSYSDCIENAMPSVVSLYASKSINVGRAVSNNSVKILRENSLGSGVIVSESGLIITNSHIIEQAQRIEVVTSEDKVYTANIAAIDKSLDLAILKINAKNGEKFKKAEFADSSDLKVGDLVFALGNPFGIGLSASMGIISALGRVNLSVENSQYLIQTDAAINPGNSGGALINAEGKVIGINSAIFSKTTSFSGVSLAVPSNAVRFVIDSLTEDGKIKKAWFGIRGTNISSNLKSKLNLKSRTGVYVTQVGVNSSAAKAGVRPGDVLIRLQNFPIANTSSLGAITSTLPANKDINLDIIRKNRKLTLKIRLNSVEARANSKRYAINGNNVFRGVVLEKLSQELNYLLGLPINAKGLSVVEVPQRMASLNLQPKDILLEINREKVTSIKAFKEILEKNKYSRSWKIKVLRNGKEINLLLK